MSEYQLGHDNLYKCPYCHTPHNTPEALEDCCEAAELEATRRQLAAVTAERDALRKAATLAFDCLDRIGAGGERYVARAHEYLSQALDTDAD